MPAPKKYKFNGIKHTTRTLSEIHGVPIKLINQRLGRGWKLKRAIKPLPESLRQKAIDLGIHPCTYWVRLNKKTNPHKYTARARYAKSDKVEDINMYLMETL